jgi:benzoate membrane transport protein
MCRSGRWQRLEALAGADGRIRHAGVSTLPAFISIALPLFIVTMASQNIPGIAVMKVNGYETQPGPLFASTGFFSLLSAPFGGHAVNLAAITAAMCAGPDAHPDPKRRYWAVLVCGICYLILGPLAGAVTASWHWRRRS